VVPGLVVHGPLQALLMAEPARPALPDRCDDVDFFVVDSGLAVD